MLRFASPSPAAQQVIEGRLRGLAVTSKTRSQALPNLPTTTELGYPDVTGDNWQGLVVPAGTPKQIIAFLHGEIVKIVALPDIRERLAVLGFEPVASTPEEFAEHVKVDLERDRAAGGVAGLFLGEVGEGQTAAARQVVFHPPVVALVAGRAGLEAERLLVEFARPRDVSDPVICEGDLLEHGTPLLATSSAAARNWTTLFNSSQPQMRDQRPRRRPPAEAECLSRKGRTATRSFTSTPAPISVSPRGRSPGRKTPRFLD
jgi:hypothetical protein